MAEAILEFVIFAAICGAVIKFIVIPQMKKNGDWPPFGK